MKAEVGALRLVHARTEIPAPKVFVYDTTGALLPGHTSSQENWARSMLDREGRVFSSL